MSIQKQNKTKQNKSKQNIQFPYHFQVGADLFRTHLEPMLKNCGYQGNFSASSLVAEGVATFFKKDRFELLKEERFDFSKLLEKVCFITDSLSDMLKCNER